MFRYVALICMFYLTEVKQIYDDMYSKVHSWINGLPARISMKIRHQFGDLPEKDMDFQVSWKPLLINVSSLYQKLIVQLQFDLFFNFLYVMSATTPVNCRVPGAPTSCSILLCRVFAAL